MIRLRIKCFSLESWVDLNKKIGKHFESWVDLNQHLGIHLNHELILSQFLESRLSWIDSSLEDTAWVMSWFKPICREGTWVGSQKNSYEVSTSVESPEKVIPSQLWSWMPKKVMRNWEWIASLSHELIRIQILKSFMSRELIGIKILDFWVMSVFESNFRNPFWIVSWFESILVKPLRVMGWVESKVSETELNLIKNWVVPMSAAWLAGRFSKYILNCSALRHVRLPLQNSAGHQEVRDRTVGVRITATSSH